MVEIRLEWEVSWKKLKNRRFGWGLAKPSCSGGVGGWQNLVQPL